MRTSGPINPVAQTSAATPALSHQIYSDNGGSWAGAEYGIGADGGGVITNGESYQGIQGTFTEPTFVGTPNPTFHAIWTGLGGDGNATFLQNGTDIAVSSPALYYGWIENWNGLGPNNPHTTDFYGTPLAGDDVMLSNTSYAPATGTVTEWLYDYTKSVYIFFYTMPLGSSYWDNGKTAELIDEDGLGQGRYYPDTANHANIHPTTILLNPVGAGGFNETGGGEPVLYDFSTTNNAGTSTLLGCTGHPHYIESPNDDTANNGFALQWCPTSHLLAPSYQQTG